MLEALDADLLLKNRCLFGGGTAIALAHGEYRESVDVDFVCSSIDGYRELRGIVSKSGIAPLFRTPIAHLRAPKIDQYGIRCAVAVDRVPIKFEVVFEGRVALADPTPTDNICGVWTLAMEDRVATKLMANSDRWADDSVMGRDLIDLAMLTETGALDRAGVAKAKRAYGESIVTDFAKARAHLVDHESRLKLCMQKMGMTMPIEGLRRRIEALHLEPDEPVERPRAALRPKA